MSSGKTKSKEFMEGVRAYKKNQPEDSCPYPSNASGEPKRSDWYNGYFETRLGTTLGPIFKRHNVSWP
ncbi:hypothetical protein UFOVP448_48 [uncultured Caudovirales phage]|uniref:Uncharacterized protein n=1 Tax=uncultured Caudovirales phage TaxID=2100421 RepID=A0A6J5M882_9CAUD|nr:hypothetical protein UFOVP448_48 [uncultured Caudovirales phage]